MLTPEQIYQIARQAGFSPAAATVMTAIAMAESGGNPRALNPTGEYSVGLWQINMRAHGDRYGGAEALYDPLTNARAAFQISGGGTNISPWTVTHTTKGARYLAHRARAEQAARAAGEDPTGANWGGSPGYQTPTPATASGTPTSSSAGGGFVGGQPATITLPEGAARFNIAGKDYAVFGYGWGDPVTIAFEVVGDVVFPPDAWSFTAASWAELGLSAPIRGGTTAALRDFPTDKTFQQVVDEFIDQWFPVSHPLREGLKTGQAKDVLQVMLEVVGRGIDDPLTIERMLADTDWYQSHNEAQLKWNNASQAERDRLVRDAAAAVVDSLWSIAGVRRNLDDWDVQAWAMEIASGKTSLRALERSVFYPYAAKNPESPFNRETRREEEAQRQRSIDIENQAGAVREMAERWGIRWADSLIQDWGTRIVENRASEEDLVRELRNQAQVLYPWKDPEMETLTAAQPWIQTYERTMERSGGLFNPEIQRALSSGMPVWEFERTLKKSDQWLNTTKNARDSLGQVAEVMGRQMGFA